MEEQPSTRLQKEEASDTEFKYIVHIRAFETFRNTLRREGIAMPEALASNLSFASFKRFNMREYQARGLIWSYSIIRVRRVEDVIEED
jgi:hypothetical protein